MFKVIYQLAWRALSCTHVCFSNMCTQRFRLPVIGTNKAFTKLRLFSNYFMTFNLSYLYEETKNSEAIFVVECVHNVGIFSIVAYKV